MGWARKTELVPALRVRAPVVRMKGLAIDPILPAALKVRDAALIDDAVRVVRIAPACAVRERLFAVMVAVGSVMAEVILISPVVCTRERDEAVIVATL